MAIRKSERIMNLTICLLSTRRFLTREQIRRGIEGYAALSDEAFERAFERDKDDLRAMGVPIQTGPLDPYFDNEVGYRIARKDFELPPVELTADEATVVGIAARAFDVAGLRTSTQNALVKLRAAGVDVEPAAAAVIPTVPTQEAAFEPLWSAALTRTLVRFDYPDSGTGEPAGRIVEPWAIRSHRGAWYLIGYDRDRQDRRVFKLSRIAGAVRPNGQPGSFGIPDDSNLRQITADDVGPQREAVLAVRPERAPALRRRGEVRARDVDGRDELVVGYRNSADLVSEVAGHGADVVVVEPIELRAQVIARLTHVATTANANALAGQTVPTR